MAWQRQRCSPSALGAGPRDGPRQQGLALLGRERTGGGPTGVGPAEPGLLPEDAALRLAAAVPLAVAAFLLEEHRVREAARPAVVDGVADPLRPPLHGEALAAEGDHLRHERKPVQRSRRVERREDLPKGSSPPPGHRAETLTSPCRSPCTSHRAGSRTNTTSASRSRIEWAAPRGRAVRGRARTGVTRVGADTSHARIETGREVATLVPGSGGPVLQLSMRRVHDLVAFCAPYELEDVVASVTGADRVEIDDYAAIEWSRRLYKLGRKALRSRAVARALVPRLRGAPARSRVRALLPGVQPSLRALLPGRGAGLALSLQARGVPDQRDLGPGAARVPDRAAGGLRPPLHRGPASGARGGPHRRQAVYLPAARRRRPPLLPPPLPRAPVDRRLQHRPEIGGDPRRAAGPRTGAPHLLLPRHGPGERPAGEAAHLPRGKRRRAPPVPGQRAPAEPVLPGVPLAGERARADRGA